MDYFNSEMILVFGIVIGIALTLAAEFAMKEVLRK